MRGIELLISLVICFGAAGLGALLTMPGLPWLKSLRKPSFYPPNWIFAPVWNVLYFLMGLSAWYLYECPSSFDRTFGLILFGVQLVLNVGWSAIFFYARKPGWALFEVVFLLDSILAYTLVAKRVCPLAAVLFIPYILWVGFAVILNASLWSLNKATNG